MPRYFCCAAKCFCDILISMPITSAESGITMSAISVIVTLMVSMTMMIPSMLIIAHMKFEML